MRVTLGKIEAVSKVAASLAEFRFRQPIVVDGNGVVVVGHTRLLAAHRLGMAESFQSIPLKALHRPR